MEIATHSWCRRAVTHNWLAYPTHTNWQKSLQKAPIGRANALLRNVITALLFLTFFCLHTPTSWAASSSEGLTVDPVFQEIELSDEAKIETTLYITNNTLEAQEISVTANDIIQENLTGKLIFLADTLLGYPHSLAPYIQFDTDRFVIPPGETKALLVTVQNRATLGPGGHYSAVIVQAHSEESAQNTTILPGLASIIFVRKTGNATIQHQLETLTGFNKGFFSPPTAITMNFHSTGNTHIIPRGTIKVTGWKKRLLAQTTINQDSAVIFPNTRRTLTSTLPYQEKLWPMELLTLELSYRDTTEETNQIITYSGMYINPLLLSGIALGLLIFGGVKMLRGRAL